jgi:hypothetical protein
MDFTAASHNPPMWCPCGGMNLQSHPSVAKKSYALAIYDDD